MAVTVRAAGGVVVRRAAGAALEVVVVHRPRYDDWSLPKGKADDGEADDVCALREVEEETGLRCALAADLGSVEYVDAAGRPKVVRYWTMRPLAPGGPLAADVDRVVWLAPREAAALLSYERDRLVLDRVARGRFAVVRHASAGDRGAWEGPDPDRPLDERGRRQAEALASLLAGRDLDRVLTSPYRRCVETAELLADGLGLPLEERGELAEGATAEEALSLAVQGAVLCTHGDVGGLVLGPQRFRKGSAWLVDLADGVPLPVEYLRPKV